MTLAPSTHSLTNKSHAIRSRASDTAENVGRPSTSRVFPDTGSISATQVDTGSAEIDDPSKASRASKGHGSPVHTPNADNDDTRSRTSSDSEDDNHFRVPRGGDHQLDDVQQPEVASRRRRRKSRRKTMGMHRPEYVVKGSDPFDYEKKFPEDKRCEELGPMARVWRTYLEESGPFDLEMAEGWRDALDVLLVFAGLFSAVVTAFVAQTSQSLQVNYGQVTATLLIELIDVQRSAANGSFVNTIPRSDLTFRPSVSDSWVNGLWFTSLSLSLSTALFAVLTKQWIHQYMSVSSGTPQDRCRLRQFRYMGLQRWGVDLIIGLLPVLMSASLALFLVGLVLFIIPLHVSIASVVGSVTFMAFAAYLITNFLPVLYPSCPYKTPLSQYMFPLYAYIPHNISFKWFKPGDDTQADEWSPSASASLPEPLTLRDAENAAVKRFANETDVHALSWLYYMSSNPSVGSIVLQSTSALPLTSVVSLRQHIAKLSSACYFALQDLLLNVLDDQPVIEGKIDRISRALIRFLGDADVTCEVCAERKDCLSRPHSATIPLSQIRQSGPAQPRSPFHDMSRLRSYFSKDVYAQLLSLQHDNDTGDIKEIQELLLSSLCHKDICLEPIVWAHLFCGHLTIPYGQDYLDIMRHVLAFIPSLYWRVGFVSPPPVYKKGRMEIYKDTDHTTAVNFRSAIEEYLYPWIGECLVQYQRKIKDSIFNPDNDYPLPQDEKLRCLLTMAGSRSILVLPNPFRQVISNIEMFCGYDTPLVERGQTFVLPTSTRDDMGNNDRHAIVQLLCLLFPSRHFRKVPLEHQRATLVLFLRMVGSTFSQALPSVVTRDGCSLNLVAESVRIAFEDDAWASSDPSDLVKEPIHRLIVIPLFRNEAFKYAVAKRLFDPLVEKLHDSPNVLFKSYFIPRVLQMFITELSSSNPHSPISRNFLKYIREHDVLFTICALLLAGGHSKTLHDLVLLCPDDPAWPICLQKLQDYAYPIRLLMHRNIPAILAELTIFLKDSGSVGRTAAAPSAAERIVQGDDRLEG